MLVVELYGLLTSTEMPSYWYAIECIADTLYCKHQPTHFPQYITFRLPVQYVV
jgi:hypothetical protein